MGAAPGFSLIEMLVVVAIVSVLAIGATLPVSRSGATLAADGRALEGEAARLATLAILSDRAHALVVGPDGWRAERRGAGGWQAMGAATAFGATQVVTGEGRWVFLPDGRAAAGAVRLESGRAALLCEASGPAALACRGA